MELDILGGALAVASVLLLLLIIVALAFADFLGFALGASVVVFMFRMAYRSDSKKARKS